MGQFPTVLLLIQGLDRIGVLLDVGHALAAGENMAEAAALLSSHNSTVISLY